MWVLLMFGRCLWMCQCSWLWWYGVSVIVLLLSMLSVSLLSQLLGSEMCRLVMMLFGFCCFVSVLVSQCCMFGCVVIIVCGVSMCVGGMLLSSVSSGLSRVLSWFVWQIMRLWLRLFVGVVCIVGMIVVCDGCIV